MLGRTAEGLFWMFRYLERSENTARLIETGLRISLTRSSDASDEWASVLETAGAKEAFLAHNDEFTAAKVIDFLLRSPQNPSSILSVVENARSNARQVRTALTREVWEATNDAWHHLNLVAATRPTDSELPEILAMIRQDSAQVRGALHGTMLRNDIFEFARLGTFIERADNTARILDVKYYVLLPSPLHIGSSLDNAQWETVLRALSAQRAFHWQCGGEISASSIAHFLILDGRMPRSLAFCLNHISWNLQGLSHAYGETVPAHELAAELLKKVVAQSIDEVFSYGLHEFLRECIGDINQLAKQIEIDYRFVE